MKDVAIRKMKKGDLDIVSDLAMLANPFAEKAKYRKHLEEELKECPELAFVAVKGGNVVGYVMGDVRDSHTTREDIAVNIAKQRQGTGTLLLETELKALQNTKAKTVVAEVHYKCASATTVFALVFCNALSSVSRRSVPVP
jgi:predicted N-acetyltransferase YhbS